MSIDFYKKFQKNYSMRYDENWYKSLNKPDFVPPDWIFPIMWIILYFLMIAAFLIIIFSSFSLLTFFADLFFILQLILNISWAPVFFKEHNLRKAFLISALLTFFVFLTMITFFNISKIAGILFVPYFLWCMFATIICFEVLERNEW